MQRLHQDDPTGHILAKNKTNVKHISLPGEIINYRDKVRPIELIDKYSTEGLLDTNRTEILNAYYLPGDGSLSLYPGITPVNSFRVIFNSYFGTDYPILPDISYNQSGQPVPEPSPACIN